MTTPAPTPDLDPAFPTGPPLAQPTPPLPWLLGYRVLGLRLPEQYRSWVARDVTSKMFLTWRMGRTFVWSLVFIGLYALVQDIVSTPLTRRFLLLKAVPVAFALSLLASGKTLVRRTLRWQRIDKRARPVAPKGLAALDNQQAVALGVAVLVLFTGASAAFVHARRPAPLKVAKCEQPEGAVLDRIRIGLKSQRTELRSPQQLTFGDRRLVSARIKLPEETERFWIWIVEPTEVYELRTPEQAAESPTTFDPLPRERADRALGPALQRMVQCLGLDVGRPRPSPRP